jgi:hypothetical protein
MTTHKKLLWSGLALVALILVCCFGVFLGSVLTRDKAASTDPALLVSDAPVVSNAPTPTTTSTPAVTVVVLEPTPTSTLVNPPVEAALPTPTPVVVVVTATPAPAEPTPPPPTAMMLVEPAEASSDLQALITYAETIKPILDEGLAAAERDGQILEAAENNPDQLCGGENTPHPTLVADAALMDDLKMRLDGIAPPAEAATAVHKPLLDSLRLWGDALDNINLSCQTDQPVRQGVLRLGAVLQAGGSMLNFHIASDNFWRLVLVNGIEEIVGPPPK